MHDAYEPVPILEKLPLQIDCLAAWGKFLQDPTTSDPDWGFPLLKHRTGHRSTVVPRRFILCILSRRGVMSPRHE